MKPTTGTIKRAWIRNPNAPPGQPAPGRIACPCGGAPETMFAPATGDITCACGIVYTWNGYIVSQPAPLAQMWEAEKDEEEEKF